MWKVPGDGREIIETISWKRQSEYLTYREASRVNDELYGKSNQCQYALSREWKH